MLKADAMTQCAITHHAIDLLNSKSDVGGLEPSGEHSTHQSVQSNFTIEVEAV